MSRRKIGALIAAVTILGMVASCTSTVVGRASGPPAPPPPPPGPDPCSFLSPEVLAGLELAPGESRPGDPDHFVPPVCSYRSIDRDHFNELEVLYSSDVHPLEYYQQKPTDEIESGGLQWKRYPDSFTDSDYHYATDLGHLSFVGVTGTNYLESTKAREIAEKAMPYVAAHLPGGKPAPPPPVPPPPRDMPIGPLVGVEACSLLKPEQAEDVGVSGTGNVQPKDPPDTPSSGCKWMDNDGLLGIRPLIVHVTFGSSVESKIQDLPVERVEVDGRVWSVVGNDSGSHWCQAYLGVTDNSFVLIQGGNLDDPAKMCDSVRAAIPSVTANLPDG